MQKVQRDSVGKSAGKPLVKSTIRHGLRGGLATLTLALVFSWTNPSPAQAYYWGYRNLGGNLLYSLPYLGLSLIGSGAPYSSNPLYSTYSATGLLRRSVLGGYRYPLSTVQPYTLQGYQDQEPLYSPRQRYKPVRAGQYGVDEVTHAEWKPAAPNATPQTGFSPQSSTPSAIPSREEFPPVAPARTLQDNRPAGQSPIAVSFIGHINDRFNGDIRAALFDPQTRSLAKALGIVDEGQMFSTDLSDTKVELIRQILREDSLDPGSKLSTVKIMLSSSANRAKH